MNYPFWDVPHIGSGWVIGLIAIYHIMISHFAVGGGFYLPMAEAKALRENRKDWLDILQKHARFFLILTGVFGAVSGVGIWFAIGLTNPEATSTLIHNFVFGWAIEWVFFIIELSTAAVYYYTWGRIPKELHVKVGWVYAISSLLTLVIINGILTFMLFPGNTWLQVAGSGQEAHYFWNAFFNPTYWPSLLMRILVCTALAGIWALVTCSRLDGRLHAKLKTELVRWSAKWLVPSFALMPLALAFYLWQVPESQRSLLQLGMSTMGTGAFTQVTRIALLIIMTSGTIVLVVYFFAWRTPEDFSFAHAIAVLFLGLVATASGEYAREALRKPYVIGRHMFSNGIRVRDVARLNQEGFLTKSLWTTGPDKLAQGEAMFRGQCLACHTRDAYRPMKILLAGRTRESIGSLLKILHDYKPDSPYRSFMPPLAGTQAEVDALGDFLAAMISTNQTAAAENPAKPAKVAASSAKSAP